MARPSRTRPIKTVEDVPKDVKEEPAPEPSVTATTPNSRRGKTTFTDEQLLRLERFFQECPNPTAKQKLELSTELALDSYPIYIWFNNRRAREKKMDGKHLSARCNHVFTHAQLEKLEEVYSAENYPTSAAKEELGRALELDVRSVHIWFNNRRAKDKKYDKQLSLSRTIFTEEQLEKLEQTYKSNNYPTRIEHYELSQELNLEKSIIRVWFNNRRAKGKRLGSHVAGKADASFDRSNSAEGEGESEIESNRSGSNASHENETDHAGNTPSKSLFRKRKRSDDGDFGGSVKLEPGKEEEEEMVGGNSVDLNSNVKAEPKDGAEIPSPKKPRLEETENESNASDSSGRDSGIVVKTETSEMKVEKPETDTEPAPDEKATTTKTIMIMVEIDDDVIVLD